jgi:hypothetical protein
MRCHSRYSYSVWNYFMQHRHNRQSWILDSLYGHGHQYISSRFIVLESVAISIPLFLINSKSRRNHTAAICSMLCMLHLSMLQNYFNRRATVKMMQHAACFKDFAFCPPLMIRMYDRPRSDILPHGRHVRP